MIYYHNIENDSFVSINELEQFYIENENQSFYDSFECWLDRCHPRNNGALETARECHLSRLEDYRIASNQLREELSDCESQDEKEMVFEYYRDELETYICQLVETYRYL